MDVINGLLRIKRIREDLREADMRRARELLELAAEALRRASEEQKKRDQERTEREDSMYEEVCTKVVQVRDLNDLKYEVDVMKNDAQVDAKAVVDAQETRVTRRKSFDESVGIWRGAALATRKFEDLSETQREERAKHAEWLAELELEEYAGRGPVTMQSEETAEEV